VRQNSTFGTLVFIIILGLGAAIAYAVDGIAGNFAGGSVAVLAFVVAGFASAAIRDNSMPLRGRGYFSSSR
jgi:hypothetical protein